MLVGVLEEVKAKSNDDHMYCGLAIIVAAMTVEISSATWQNDLANAPVFQVLGELK